MKMPTQYLRQRWLSLVFSMLMLAMVLLTLWISHWLKKQSSPPLMIRAVSTVSLPPPPPPSAPRQQQSVDNSAVSLQVEGQGATLQKIEIDMPPLTLTQAKELVIDPQTTQWQSLDVNWNAFDLGALDSQPNLLTPLKVSLPKSISRQGINTVLIKLDVLIDEVGQVTLIEIASNPYPELEAEIHKLVRTSRFSPPQKDNEPARARFIWPIEIKS
jgi:periplasmic protein TonB